MGLFDDYFDPDQFQDSGGLYGRLLSVRPDLAFQPNGADAPNPFDGSALPVQQASFSPATAPPALNAAPTSAAGAAAASGPTQDLATSTNLPSTLFADANVSQAPLPFDLGAHLNAGFQKWAQTPVGNPFAALANGITGFNTVQPTDASFIGPPPPVQTPDFGNRLGAALQSWALTPVGSPFAALANGITGFNTGQVGVAPAATKAQTQTQDFNDQPNAPAQNPPTLPVANSNSQMLLRRPGLRKLPR